MDDQLQVLGPTRNQFRASFELVWRPDVVLVTKGDPVALAANRRLDEVLAEAEPGRIDVQPHRECNPLGKALDDRAAVVRRTFVADHQLKRSERLRSKAAQL